MKIGLSNSIKYLLFLIIICGIGFLHQSMAADKTVISSTKTKKEIVSDPSYVIGPMDLLEIQVWKEPDFSRQVLVRMDGKITLPLVGDILASGMNTMGLKALLSEKLQDFVSKPEVTVIVLESRSKNFYIIGKINQPGTYPMSPDMTVLQAISVAGGLTEWADKDNIRIIRRSGRKEEILHFDYDKVITGKKLEQNILLKPNDTIIVP
jgi:polysaccharide export outer membrane protein